MKTLDIVPFTYPNGVLFMGVGPAMPPSLRRLALRSKDEIQGHLWMVVRHDLASMGRLRHDIGRRVTSHSFKNDHELIAHVATAAARSHCGLVAVDLPDSRFSFNGSGHVAMVRFASAGRVGPLSGPFDATMAAEVRAMSVEDRFKEVLQRTAKYLPASAAAEFRRMVTPTALIAAAAALAIWAGAHFVGVGQAADVILIAVGFAAVGFEIFEVAKLVVKVVKQTLEATSEADLDAAAADLAQAISILGIAAFMALVTKTLAKRLGRRPAREPEAAPPKRSAGPQEPDAPARPREPETPVQRRPGDYGMTPQRSDEIITTKYKDYLPPEKLNGDLAQTSVKNVSLDELRAEWKNGQIDWMKANGQEITPEALARLDSEASTLGGFRSGNTIWTAKEVPNDSVLHESLHLYSSPEVKSKLGQAANEGMTDYFTRLETGTLDLKTLTPETSGYPRTASMVGEYAQKYGNEPFAKAYFSGDVGGLQKTMGSYDYQAFLTDVGDAFKADMAAVGGL